MLAWLYNQEPAKYRVAKYSSGAQRLSTYSGAKDGAQVSWTKGDVLSSWEWIICDCVKDWTAPQGGSQRARSGR